MFQPCPCPWPRRQQTLLHHPRSRVMRMGAEAPGLHSQLCFHTVPIHSSLSLSLLTSAPASPHPFSPGLLLPPISSPLGPCSSPPLLTAAPAFPLPSHFSSCSAAARSAAVRSALGCRLTGTAGSLALPFIYLQGGFHRSTLCDSASTSPWQVDAGSSWKARPSTASVLLIDLVCFLQF